MLLLANVVQAWGAPHFMATLKREIESINIEYLPLQQGLTSSNYVLDNGISTIDGFANQEVSAVVGGQIIRSGPGGGR